MAEPLNPQQLCFNTGEISPIMYGRKDLPKYAYGCKTNQNMLTFLQGPSFRRPGTQFIGEIKNSDQAARPIPFIFSTTDAYIIEAGTGYMRFWRTNPDTEETGLITDGGLPYEIATVYDENEVFDIHFDQIEDLMYLCQENHPMQKLIRVDHNDWDIGNAPIENGPFLKENDSDITVEPSGIDGDITLTASDDIFTANHVGALWMLTQNKVLPVIKGSLSGAGQTSPITTVQENTSIRITTRGTWTGTLVVEKSYDNGATWDEVFPIDSANDDNMLEEFEETIDDAKYRVKMLSWTSGTCKYNLHTLSYVWYGIVQITGFTDSRHVSALVLKSQQGIQTTKTTEEWVHSYYFRGISLKKRVVTTKTIEYLASATPTRRWAEGAWSMEQGYPTTLTFFQQRLLVASKSHRVPRIWGSGSFDFEDFFEGPDADDALYFYLATARSNPIVWLTPSTQNILIGTSYQASSIQPVNVEGTIQTFSGPGGSGAIQPDKFETGKLTGNTILFIERQGQKIYQIGYSQDVDNYIGLEDLSIIAEHITKPSIVGMVFQQQPIPVLWFWRSDGVLCSMVYSRIHNIASFASHPMDNGFVEWATVIPSAVTGQDEVWLAVRRTINGSVKRYFERLNPIELEPDAVEDCQYLDCSMTYEGEPTTTISGLDHLIGETVSILADGYVLDDQVVDSEGEIALAESASKVVVGLPYTSKLTTLDLQFAFQNGTTKGKKIKIPELNLDFYNTGSGVKFGPDDDNLTELDFSQSDDPEDEPTPLFSGIWPREERGMPFVGDWQKEISVTITQDKPLPLVIRSIIPKVLVEGK